MFSGLFWTGEKSVELGLADGYGTTDTVARDVLKAPDLVDYTVKESLTNRVARKSARRRRRCDEGADGWRRRQSACADGRSAGRDGPPFIHR
ncbi:hypothetical protein FOC42_37030 [Burkholderia cenocepacia]|uniref:hypothetical protein n=1 Tax=Burkholderia cenocepacia TaxID=95486 RepID=UPI001581A9E9|nr:hypothetical protein [Burkholderia cenocepacia]QKT97210.1 hypothetical protein FOC42_37030 [Burkholderia cenocepacia]